MYFLRLFPRKSSAVYTNLPNIAINNFNVQKSTRISPVLSVLDIYALAQKLKDVLTNVWNEVQNT